MNNAPNMRWKTESKPLGVIQRFRLSFAVALVLTILIGYQEWLSTRHVSNLYLETIRTTDVLRTLEDLIWSANTVEAEQQRYFVTRNPKHLRLAQAESEKLAPILEKVGQLADHYPWESEFVQRLEAAVKARLNDVGRPINSSRSAHYSSVLNNAVHDFEEAERQMLKASHDGSAAAVTRSSQFVFTGIFFTLLVDCLSWFIADQELVRRTRAEEELQRAHDELEAVLGGIDVGVIAQSITGEILYANTTMAKLLGAPSPVALKGKLRGEVASSYEVRLAEGSTQEQAPTEIAIRTHRPTEGSLTVGSGPARKTVLQRAIPVLRSDGAVSMVISLFRDITEQKKIEEMLEEQQARAHASSKLSALGEMAGGIAHEINNPLAIIQGQATQLKEMVESHKWEREWMEEAAASIEKTSRRIAKIVKGLRAFARDGSADPFQPTPVKALVEETLDFCRERFKHHAVALLVDPIDPDLTMECRSVQISQVLLNLLNNAYDAVENRPERWIRIQVRDAGSFVEIAVVDSGPGIPLSLQEKLMRPFFTTKEIGKGTGVGLSISRGIVESHGGTLQYDAGPPNTRFVALLPKEQVASAKEQTASAAEVMKSV